MADETEKVARDISQSYLRSFQLGEDYQRIVTGIEQAVRDQLASGSRNNGGAVTAEEIDPGTRFLEACLRLPDANVIRSQFARYRDAVQVCQDYFGDGAEPVSISDVNTLKQVGALPEGLTEKEVEELAKSAAPNAPSICR